MAQLFPLLQAGSNEWLFQSERIWAVLTVVVLIWVGVLTVLFLLGRRLGQLEKRLDQLEQQPNSQQPASEQGPVTPRTNR